MPMYSLDGMAGGKSTNNINAYIKSPILKNLNPKNL